MGGGAAGSIPAAFLLGESRATSPTIEKLARETDSLAEGEGFKTADPHGRGASFETTGSDLRARNLLPPGACDWARTDPYECYRTSPANGAGRCWDRAAAITALIANNRWNGCEMIKTFSRPLSQQQNPNRLEPTRKPRLDLLEKDQVKAKRPSMWNIVFYNDDYTSMDFVVFVLTKVFHRSTEDALALTMAVHTQGKGIAGTYTFEVAEQKQCEVLLMAKIEEHPLRVEVEKV
jgi:ATP-dependent Clp protease adaptor protein ClpS